MDETFHTHDRYKILFLVQCKVMNLDHLNPQSSNNDIHELLIIFMSHQNVVDNFLYISVIRIYLNVFSCPKGFGVKTLCSKMSVTIIFLH